MSSSGLLNAVILASQFGNLEFVVEMVESNPALLHVNTTAGGIFHVAVANRQEKIWNLIYGFGAEGGEFARFVDPDLNTLLHVAGMLAPAKRFSNISGAAMQMQREMQWYKIA
ncbi:hypothetical protein F0562_027883 [Nyssa sinensis]|uniref:PGG domain-containing protein n=1 Tax=Nyssa sinensis TaxID=561372 RepID=A0A5J5B6T2_9ASTE|nr:hypothetical protein F0562_027883 [Nyssa sinensis]